MRRESGSALQNTADSREQLGPTPQEPEVQFWLAADNSNPEFADTAATVKKQVLSILDMLAASSPRAGPVRCSTRRERVN